jgi:hypothetical protein
VRDVRPDETSGGIPAGRHLLFMTIAADEIFFDAAAALAFREPKYAL